MRRTRLDGDALPRKYDIARKSQRRNMVEFVLAKMQDDGELPSLRAQTYMDQFVDGEMSLQEVHESILEDGLRNTDKTLTSEARAERRIAVNSSLGTTLAEGVSPSEDALVLFEKYVEGEVSLEDLGNLIRCPYGLPFESAQIDLRASETLLSIGA